MLEGVKSAPADGYPATALRLELVYLLLCCRAMKSLIPELVDVHLLINSKQMNKANLRVNLYAAFLHLPVRPSTRPSHTAANLLRFFFPNKGVSRRPEKSRKSGTPC